jgi:hypothetical protein
MNPAQEGEAIDVSALLADRPDLIERGGKLVAGLESLRLAAGPARPGNSGPLPDPLPGEFRILRPLGEGTFGKV